MSKFMRVGLFVVAAFLLAGCAPYINAGNKNMVTIFVHDTTYERDALALADKHCGQYGMTAKLRKPRPAYMGGSLYDYNCVE